MNTITQGTLLRPRATFSFKVNDKGRAITFKAEQWHWVTNTRADQTRRGAVNIARRGQTTGYDFTPEQVTELFQENAK